MVLTILKLMQISFIDTVVSSFVRFSSLCQIVLKSFQICFKLTSSLFQMSFKFASNLFQMYFKLISNLCQIFQVCSKICSLSDLFFFKCSSIFCRKLFTHYSLFHVSFRSTSILLKNEAKFRDSPLVFTVNWMQHHCEKDHSFLSKRKVNGMNMGWLRFLAGGIWMINWIQYCWCRKF